jgi:hypothetical protein
VLARVSSAAIVPITATARLLGALRTAGSVIAAGIADSNVLQHVGAFVRSAGVSLSVATTTARTLVLGRIGSALVSVVTSAAGSGSFSPPLVQIANWALSRTRKGIRELVLAYQSIQSRLGHTSDTSANFDAGFATFSGQDDSPLPNFPDPRPGVPQLELPLDLWVAARLQPGNYDLITAFASAQELVRNEQASFASYDALYQTFIQAQENVTWRH